MNETGGGKETLLCIPLYAGDVASAELPQFYRRAALLMQRFPF